MSYKHDYTHVLCGVNIIVKSVVQLNDRTRISQESSVEIIDYCILNIHINTINNSIIKKWKYIALCLNHISCSLIRNTSWNSAYFVPFLHISVESVVRCKDSLG